MLQLQIAGAVVEVKKKLYMLHVFKLNLHYTQCSMDITYPINMVSYRCQQASISAVQLTYSKQKLLF